jgi:protein SEY1
MWENQVGLYNGANYGLFRTVFEVNLDLFGKHKEYVDPHIPSLPLIISLTNLTLSLVNSCGSNSQTQRTLLLFVIRDHMLSTPLSNLRDILLEDLYSIWESLAKPDGLSDAKLDDYFVLAFEALPHKVSCSRPT